MLLILAIVIGLPIIGIGGCSYWLFGQLKGPMDETNSFMALVQDGAYDDALASSDPSCATSIGGFLDEAKTDNVQEYNFFFSGLTTQNGVTTGSTDGTVTFSQSGSINVRVELTKTGDEWRVCQVLPGVGPGAP